MKTLKEVTGATAVVLVWTIMCLLISHKVDRPADPGTEVAAVEQSQKTSAERPAETVLPPIPPWTVVTDSKGRYNYSFDSGYVGENTTYPTAQAAHDAMIRFRTLFPPAGEKPAPSDWVPVDVSVDAPGASLKVNPSTNDPLMEVLYYLLAERQEQESMYSAMVERIDQDADMVIDAIPDLPGLQLDQDEWEGAE